MHQLTVSYDRKFGSTGYGSEGLHASWTWDVEEDEPTSEAIESVAAFLRTQILSFLARYSVDYQVRDGAIRELQAPRPRALSNAPEAPPDDDADVTF